MGWNFRKRITLFPGLRLNFSKSGTSLNVGPKGSSISFGKKGTFLNSGIVGTGIYRRDKISDGSFSCLGCLHVGFQLLLGVVLAILTIYYLLLIVKGQYSSCTIRDLVLIGEIFLLLIIAHFESLIEKNTLLGVILTVLTFYYEFNMVSGLYSNNTIFDLMLIGEIDLLLIAAIIIRRIKEDMYEDNPLLSYLTTYAIIASIVLESFFIIEELKRYYLNLDNQDYLSQTFWEHWDDSIFLAISLIVLWLIIIAIYKIIKKIINHFRSKKAAKVQEEIKAYDKKQQDKYKKIAEIEKEISQRDNELNELKPVQPTLLKRELTPREKIEKKHGKLLVDVAYYLLNSQRCSRKDLQVEFRESEMNIRYILKDLEKYHIIEDYGNGRYKVTITSEDDLLTKLDVAQESTGSEDYDSNLALADPTYAYTDPLFKEVVGFILYWQEINVKKIRLHFGIGLNRTLAMLKTMKELGIIDYRGNYREIKMTEEEVNNLFNNNQTTNN